METRKNPIVAALLGNGLGHPLHPAIVHIPIALWVGALVFDALTLSNIGGNGLVRTSFWAILIGLISTLLVVPSGIAEWMQIKREKPAWTLALWHMLLNVCVTVIMVVSLILRTGSALTAQRVPMMAFVLVVVADVVLMVSGYIGGRMVYEHGIGVARQTKNKWREIAAAGNANLPPQQ